MFKIARTVVFGIPRSFYSSRTVNRRSPSIASHTRSMFSGVVVSEGRPERGSLSTDVWPFLNRLYHSSICVMPIFSSTNAFCIISIVSVQLLPRLKQNLMQIRWSVLSVIFNCKQMDERKKHVGHKHTLRATKGVRPVTTAFREFVRDYWLRTYPAEAARALWREHINAGRILFGHTSYVSSTGPVYKLLHATIVPVELEVVSEPCRSSITISFSNLVSLAAGASYPLFVPDVRPSVFLYIL